MTTLLDRLSRTSVCIEFKDDLVVISCFKCDFTGVTLLATSTFPSATDDETVANISRFLAGNVRGPMDALVSIPFHWSILKFIEIPSPKTKGKDAVASMMKFEIERHIPYQQEDIFFDFMVTEKGENTYKVIAAAVHKSRIKYVKEFLDRFACRPRSITLSPFAVLNSIEFSSTPVAGIRNLLGFAGRPDILGRRGENIISVFVDDKTASVAVLSGGSCVHMTSFDPSDSTSVTAVADDICSWVSAVMRELSLEKIHKLLLSGSVASMAELPGMVSERLGTGVSLVDPAARILKGKTVPEAYRIYSSLGLCYSGAGAGSLRINVLPHKAGPLFRRSGVMVSKVTVPVIVLMIIGIFVGDIVHEKKTLSMIEKKISENEPEVAVIQKISSDTQALRERQEFLLAAREGTMMLDILSELAERIPSDAWISGLQYKTGEGEEASPLRGELLLSGFAKSASPLISLLEESPYFEGVEFAGPINKRGGNEEFRIKAVTVRPQTAGKAEPESGQGQEKNASPEVVQ